MKGTPSILIRNPDDPRHGTVKGAVAHNTIGDKACEQCLRAKRIYEAQRRMADTPEKKVPALGTRRRINALRALGWSKPYLCRQLGLANRSLDHLLDPDYESVTRTVADNIDALYRRLCMKPPPQGPGAERARTWARKAGCVPPLAWDDIDNDEAPAASALPDPPKPGWKDRPEILRRADEEGKTAHQVAESLGVSLEGLNRWCKRHDYMDVYWRLLRRDPRFNGNQYAAA